MGLFDKLFGGKDKNRKSDESKKDKPLESLKEHFVKHDSPQKGASYITSDDGNMFLIIRDISEKQKVKLRESTIQLMPAKLYMHYWTDRLTTEDRNDPQWQNKVMFFWTAEEPFQKKSLPPVFENYKVKHFVFMGDVSNISMQVGKAIPWFGMPGGGDKHVCSIKGENVSIPELNNLGIVDYIEVVNLSENNTEILKDRAHYMFLVDERMTPYVNNEFRLNGKPISIEMAYMIGGIHIVKKVRLE